MGTLWVYIQPWILPIGLSATIFVAIYFDYKTSNRHPKIQFISFFSAIISGMILFIVLIQFSIYCLITDLSKLEALNYFESHFYKIKHFPESKLLSHQKLLGNFSGTGNHCDYFVGEMRKVVAKEKAISDFYSRLTLPLAEPDHFKGDYSENGVYVIFIKNPQIFKERYIPYELNHLESWNLNINDFNSKELIFLVFSIDSGNGRGHHWGCG
ncbi:MAG: hypothetical protein AB7I41_07365 [Candidatus Sericytochromatia bacterium]